jgi:hypothetical protein
LAIFKQKGGEQFHNNFKASYQAPKLGLRRLNLGFTFEQQFKNVQQQKMVGMRVVGHVLTRLGSTFEQD